MKHIFSIILIGMSVTTLYAKSNVEPKVEWSPETNKILAEAKKSVKGITVTELKPLILSGKVILIDVRPPCERGEGMINTKRLVKLPRGLLEFKYPEFILEKYTKNDHFVVYCSLGGRALLSAKALKDKFGFTNVQYLIGGMKAYNELK